MSPPAAWSRTKSSRVPLWAGALAMFIVLVPLYTLSIDMRASWGASITGDEPFYLITTQSLLQDGDLDTSNQFASSAYESFFDHTGGLWRQSIPRADGALLSPHNPGLSVLLLPGFAVGGLLGAQVEMVLIAAATFALTFVLVARLTRSLLVAWVSVLAVALTAPAFVYSSEIYPEVPAALAVVIALVIVRSTGSVGRWRAVALVLVLTTLPWLGAKYVPLVAVLGVYSIWRATSGARVVMLVSGLLSAACYIWFHMNVFGGLTPYSVNIVYAGRTTTGIVGAHFEFLDRTYRLWGLFIDQRFGVGRWAPLLLVGAVAAPLLWKQTGSPRLVLALLLIQLLSATFIAITMMGWWFPGRTLMAVLPLAGLPVAYAWIRAGLLVKVAIAGAALYSVAVTTALALAGHAREVAVAVNPFDMESPIFTIPAFLFPNYMSWTLHTWVATTIWLGAIGAVIAIGLAGRLLAKR